ncbi:MAG: phosphoribosyltransferase [Burkholderiales bacterium]|nr:MAG: phosphoribosyltransferase [Burkholderiales bacterium]
MSSEHLHVSWDTYHGLIERLALTVHESGWHFDEILCIARGGMRVGDVLSRIFECPLGVLFTSSYRAQAGTRQGTLVIGDAIASALPMKGPRVLLVDDLVDSGATYVRLMPELRSRYPEFAEIRTAVIWVKGSSEFQPDYRVVDLPSSPWIHQPVEVYDAMRPDQLDARVAEQKQP